MTAIEHLADGRSEQLIRCCGRVTGGDPPTSPGPDHKAIGQRDAAARGPRCLESGDEVALREALRRPEVYVAGAGRWRGIPQRRGDNARYMTASSRRRTLKVAGGCKQWMQPLP